MRSSLVTAAASFVLVACPRAAGGDTDSGTPPVDSGSPVDAGVDAGVDAYPAGSTLIVDTPDAGWARPVLRGESGPRVALP